MITTLPFGRVSAGTRWGYTIDSVHGDSAFATFTESNEFYDLLAVGPRTQREIFVASGGRIRIMRGLTMEHPGGDFDSIYTAYKRWVIDTARVRDSVRWGTGCSASRPRAQSRCGGG